MKKLVLLLIAMGLMIPFSSCKKDDTPKKDKSDEQEQKDPSSQDSGTTAAVPDCFVYYKGATFVFKRTVDNKTSSKITWTVTDFNSSSNTATVQEIWGDNNPTTFQIRKGSKCIEFNKGSGWKALTDGGSGINFMNGSDLNSIPSGCYGSVKKKTDIETVSIPGGKTSSGFSISSTYQNATGSHDSFLFDYSSGESWSTQCGFVSSGYWYQNGKEYPIFSMRTNVELVAYDIPMPDGSRRTYAPAGSTVYDVTDTFFHCYQNDYKTQRYACIFAYWNDTRNTNVMRYRLGVIWYQNDMWNYGFITDDLNTSWQLSCWFAGQAYSGNGYGFEGHYSSDFGSQSYSPWECEGWYIFFVVAENAINVGEPDFDNTVYNLLYIPNDGSAASTDGIRVKLLDGGNYDYYNAAPAKSPLKITPGIPPMEMIEGPVHKLNR